jgi:hypothetical protein
VTVSLRALSAPEQSLESAERVDEVGICLLGGRRVKRGWRFGQWSSWELDG